VAALVPRAELEGEMGDSHVGLQARLMSQALRKLTAIVAKSKTTLVFINQIREKIGVMFGSPETTTGGRALKFYSSVRIDIRRIGQIKDGEEPIGARTKATVVKNKVAPPFKKCEFDILFAEGINRLGEVLDLGVESNFLKRSGTWISYGETRLGQGREKARDFLKENPQLSKEIEDALLAFMQKRQTGASQTGASQTGAAPAAAATNGSGAAAAILAARGEAVRPETRPTDGKPADAKPADGKSADGKSADGKSIDGKLVEGRPIEGRPIEGRSGLRGTQPPPQKTTQS
jgi:recombination protein RecA